MTTFELIKRIVASYNSNNISYLADLIYLHDYYHYKNATINVLDLIRAGVTREYFYDLQAIIILRLRNGPLTDHLEYSGGADRMARVHPFTYSYLLHSMPISTPFILLLYDWALDVLTDYDKFDFDSIDDGLDRYPTDNECPICLELYHSTCKFRCVHSVCTPCYNQLTKLMCPICRLI